MSYRVLERKRFRVRDLPLYVYGWEIFRVSNLNITCILTRKSSEPLSLPQECSPIHGVNSPNWNCKSDLRSC